MIQSSAVSSFVAFFARCLLGAHARWFCPNDAATQRIYFANHTSHLDTLILWSLLSPSARRLTRPVAAKDFWSATCFRRFVARDVFNAVLIERPDRAGNGAELRATLASRAFSAMVEAMGDTCSLIVFPEGTRGDGITMRPFKSGLYHLAHTKPGLEMIPVYLENLNRILPKGELLPIPLLGSVSFGPPLYLAAQETKNEFLERARHAIEELRG